jgi:hypothetical protein
MQNVRRKMIQKNRRLSRRLVDAWQRKLVQELQAV